MSESPSSPVFSFTLSECYNLGLPRAEQWQNITLHAQVRAALQGEPARTYEAIARPVKDNRGEYGDTLQVQVDVDCAADSLKLFSLVLCAKRGADSLQFEWWDSLEGVKIAPGALLKISDNTFAGGNGKSANPYLIANPRQLDNVRHYLQASFRQCATIDLGDAIGLQAVSDEQGLRLCASHELAQQARFYRQGRGWEPLGNAEQTFQGEYDGQKHSVQNLCCLGSDSEPAGLFGQADAASMRKLRLTGTILNPDGCAGALLGKGHKQLQISVCINYCTVQAAIAGGLVGASLESITLSNSLNNGLVSSLGTGMSSLLIGGLVGNAYKGSAEHCSNFAPLRLSGNCASEGHLGGLFANVYGECNAENCQNHGALTIDIDAESNVTCGGLAGSAGRLNMNYCRNLGSISAQGNGKCVGGIVGFAKTGSIAQGANYGAITVAQTSTCHCGGILGRSEAQMTLQCCKNYASLEHSDVYCSYLAGILGTISGGTLHISNCQNLAQLRCSRSQRQAKIGGLVASAQAPCQFAQCVSVGELCGEAIDAQLTLGGLIACSAYNTSVEHSSNSATLQASNCGAVTAGGIIGHSQADTSLSKCSNRGNIRGESVEKGVACGGLIGSAAGELYLSQCDNIASLNFSQANDITLGGLLGQARAETRATQCSNSGTLRSTNATAGSILGGIGGQFDRGVTLRDVINSGEVTGIDGELIMLGGIAGRIQGDSLLKQVANMGHIHSATFQHSTALGGIIGAQFGTLTMDCCSHMARITVEESAGGVDMGGLVGIVDKDAHLVLCTSGGECHCAGSVRLNFGGLVANVRAKIYLKDCRGENYATLANLKAEAHLGALCGLIMGRSEFVHSSSLTRLRIKDCACTAIYVGHMAAEASKSIKVRHCKSDGSIATLDLRATLYLGGFVGRSREILLDDCVHTGDIDCRDLQKAYAGGLLGAGCAELQSTGCISTGNITITKADDAYCGGLVGRLEASTDAISVASSRNEGNLVVRQIKQAYMGGLIGSCEEGDSMRLNACHNLGALTCYQAREAVAIGGILGRSLAPITADSTDNSARVFIEQATGQVLAGGWAGFINSGYLDSCLNRGQLLINCAYNPASSAPSRVSGGGFLGQASGAVILRHLTNRGAISTNDVNGAGFIGGIIGTANGNAKLDSCSSASSMECLLQNGDAVMGGLVGILEDNGTIIESAVSGTFRLTTSPSVAYLGGFVGIARRDMQIRSSYAIGQLHPHIIFGISQFPKPGQTIQTAPITASNQYCPSLVSDAPPAIMYCGGLAGIIDGHLSSTNCYLMLSTAPHDLSELPDALGILAGCAPHFATDAKSCLCHAAIQDTLTPVCLFNSTGASPSAFSRNGTQAIQNSIKLFPENPDEQALHMLIAKLNAMCECWAANSYPDDELGEGIPQGYPVLRWQLQDLQKRHPRKTAEDEKRERDIRDILEDRIFQTPLF